MANTRFMAGAAALVLAAGLALGATPAGAQDFTMKLATLTLNDSQHEFLKMYKAEIEKVSNGRIKAEIYPAGQLGNAQRQSEGLRLGTIEAASGPAELFVGADPRFQGLAMAGLFKDINHARKALLVPQVRQAISEVAASRGLVFISAHVFDLQSFVFKTPVTKIADFSGKRVRVLASEGERAMVSALGGAPVPMTLGEVLPAIQQGTIDGANSGIPVYIAFKYHDAAPNMIDTHLWAIITLGLVSKTWYDKLPPDLQKAIVETGTKVEAETVKWSIAREDQDKKSWAAAGGKTFYLSAAEQQDAVKRVTDAIQPILEKNAPLKAFYDKVKAGAATVN